MRGLLAINQLVTWAGLLSFMRLFPRVLFFLGLAACNAAGPGFHGVEKTVREVDGSTFVLRFQNDLVEVTRSNPEWMPRFDDIARKAATAAQLESGCRADWVQGDPAMMWIGLSCDGDAAPTMPRRHRSLYCAISHAAAKASDGTPALTCSRWRR